MYEKAAPRADAADGRCGAPPLIGDAGQIGGKDCDGTASSPDDWNQVRLPGADRAVVNPAKLRDYLLSYAHPVGRFKAEFFAAMGYAAADWSVLESDLRRHARENDAKMTEANEYGQKYEVGGSMAGPSGKSAMVVAVWIVLRGESVPRFVTAFPGAES